MEKQGLHMLLDEQKAPEGLYERVMLHISLLERRSARLRAGLFGLLSLISLAALVPTLQYASEQFAASGFYAYATLLFSDSSLVVTYWREFSLSLIESLPSLALLILIPVVILLVWSVRRTAQTARVAFS